MEDAEERPRSSSSASSRSSSSDDEQPSTSSSLHLATGSVAAAARVAALSSESLDVIMLGMNISNEALPTHEEQQQGQQTQQQQAVIAASSPGVKSPVHSLDVSAMSRWIHCVCVVTFDLELGQGNTAFCGLEADPDWIAAMECVYPPEAELSEAESANMYSPII